MNWIPQFSSGYFAAAGAICAAGPIVIHLLNRRRFRVLDWAAMDFLLQALRRQKRRIQLRDWILLLLRTAAVLCFGIALARPFFSATGSGLDASSPRHLIVLIDNSLSMGYRAVDQTLLEDAKEQAGELLDSLPDGSQVTIAATCGTEQQRRGPIRRREDARDLLHAVQLVDGVSRVEEVVAAARQAQGKAAPLPDQIVLFTDMQSINWPSEINENLFDALPTIQIRDLSRPTWDNAWVADVQLRDDVVDLDSPATVFVTVRRQGPSTRRAQVTLSINGQSLTSRSVEFPAGQLERRLVFECLFSDAPVEPGQASFVPLTVSITPDRLEQDDSRTIMVPVVTSLPVVFIDQYAEDDEDAALGRLGETRPLRHLLAPREVAGERPLVAAQHVTISQVTRSLLSTARLVVVAGVEDPSSAVDILSEYVRQGGPLVIAAGGRFDTSSWNLAAGPQAAQLLPARLQDQMLGLAPDEAGEQQLKPFSLSLDSLINEPLLRLPGLSDEELGELYREPLFFKAAVLDPATIDGNTEELAVPSTRWLAWQPLDLAAERSTSTGSRRARVLARLDDSEATPLLVHHQLGQGQVLFSATSLLPTWNNLAQTNAVVLWDHLSRSLIRSTLPERNFSAQERLSVPLSARQRGVTVRLHRPDKTQPTEVTEVGFIESNRAGVTITNAWQRGLYRFEAAPRQGDQMGLGNHGWSLEVAVHGEASESNLERLADEDLHSTIVEPKIGQLLSGDTLGAVETAARGSALWWWFTLVVFLLLLVEIALLAISARPLPTEARGRPGV